VTFVLYNAYHSFTDVAIRLAQIISDISSVDDLVEAMIAAKEDISESNHQDEQENNDVQENCEDEKKNIFVEEIVNAGYDLELAIKALDHVDPEDISEGMRAILRYLMCNFNPFRVHCINKKMIHSLQIEKVPHSS
jgi:hypoxanthine phosphoribosyltransferase